jgi:hypothetical protein
MKKMGFFASFRRRLDDIICFGDLILDFHALSIAFTRLFSYVRGLPTGLSKLLNLLSVEEKFNYLLTKFDALLREKSIKLLL